MENAITPEAIRAERTRAEAMLREADRLAAEAKAILSDLEAVSRLMFRMNLAKANAKPIFVGIASASEIKPTPQFFGGGPAFSVRNPFKAGTNKAFIWEVLDTAPSVWLNANEIQERASEIKGEEIPMSSISPMLTEMKRDYLERDNLRVALKSRLNEIEADDTRSSASHEAPEVQNKETTE